MKIQYNIPVEVNQKQYNTCRTEFNGICAFRTDGNKFFIKVLLMKYKKSVQKLIENK